MRNRIALLVVLLLLTALAWLASDRTPSADEPATALPEPRVSIAQPRSNSLEAAAPAGRRWREITCPLPVEVRPRSPGPDVLIEDPAGGTITSASTLNGPELKFQALFDDGVALVTLPAYEQAGLLWFTDAEGRVDCLFPRDPERAPTGIVRLRGAPGNPADFAYYSLCDGVTDEEPWREVEMPAGPCEAFACRHTGELYKCDGPFAFDVPADGMVTFDVEPPPGPLRGPDFDFRLTDEAVVVTTIPLTRPARTPDSALGTGS